jgi:hypothetical protein
MAAASLPNDCASSSEEVRPTVEIQDNTALVTACAADPEHFAARIRSINVDSMLLHLPAAQLDRFSTRWLLGCTLRQSKVLENMPALRESHLQVTS